MLLRVGGLFVVTVLAQENLGPEVSTGPTANRFHSHDDRVARTP